eukprot:4176860-Ditylum_brightwellii.AAC.1
MEGNYTYEENDAITLKLLQHCKKEQDSIELDKTISIQEWKEKDNTLVTTKLSKVKAQITHSQKKEKNYKLDKMP